MRLNKKHQGGIVGPASCLGVAGLMALGLVCPQFSKTYAMNQGDLDWSTFSSCGYEIDANDPERANACLRTTGNYTANQVEGGIMLLAAGPEVSKNGSSTITFKVEQIEEKTGSASGTITFIVNGPAKPVQQVANFVIQFNVTEFLALDVLDASGATMTTPDLDMGTITPNGTDANDRASTQQRFVVSGNNANGFGVYVKADSADLVNEKIATAKIEALKAETAYASIPANQWGYNVKSTGTALTLPDYRTLSYSGMPTTNTKLAEASSNVPSNGINFALTTTTKVDSSTPAGTYTTNVTVSAVAPFNAVPTN